MVVLLVIFVSRWAIIGTFYLMLLTYKDYKNNMVVDDRHNYLMMGMTISLYWSFPRAWWYGLSTIVMLLFLYKYIKKFKVIGDSDITAITWIFLGYAIISPFKLFWWFVFFSCSALFYILLKKYLFKIKGPTPFYGVLLTVFIFSNYMLGIY